MIKFRSDKGSVSIYFMIVFTAIFFFNAVLIDFIRIKAAEKQTENAIRAGLRSVLSNFDATLQDYGLYAVSSEAEADQIFTHVLRNNVLTGNEDDHFQLIRPKWKQIQLNVEYSLAHSEVFKQQVLEDMKYKAPIEFTLEVIDKFQKSGASNQMQEATKFAKLADELEKLIMNRDRSLDDAWSEVEKMIAPGGKIARAHNNYLNKLNEINDLASQISAYQMDEIKKNISRNHTQLEQLNDLLVNAVDEAEIKALQQSMYSINVTLANLESILNKIIKFTRLITETSISIQTDYDNLIDMQSNITEHLAEAEDYNDQLLKRLENSTEGVTAEYIHVIERSYFDEYKLGLSNTLGSFSGFNQQFDPIKLVTGIDYKDRFQRLTAANEAYHEQAVIHFNNHKRIEDARKTKNKEIESKKGSEIKKIEAILKQVQNLFSNCQEMNTDYYKKLSLLKQKYLNFNGVKADDKEIVTFDLDNSKDIGMKSMKLIDHLVMSLMNIQDRVYVNEYVLSKFNYRTLDTSSELSKPSEHLLYNQEAEYILYGLGSCVKNHGAAYAEMFGLRLAIRTMEALSDPDRSIVSVGSPLLAFLWSVAEGAVRAHEDMTELVEGKEVVLSSKLSNPIRLNYKDYLRVFLLIHSKEEEVIARTQALIDLNTGFDLTQKGTYFQANASSLTRLWFIPGVMRLLNHTVVGNEVVNMKSLDISY